MSTFAAEEHKLINYLDNGANCPGNRKPSISSMKDCKEADLQGARNPVTPTGALVSAGFQVLVQFFYHFRDKSKEHEYNVTLIVGRYQRR